MAKNDQLWDDSALVKALDDAISIYKIMHGKGGDIGSLKEAETNTKDEESCPNFVTGSNETKIADVEINDKSTDVQKNTTCIRETMDSSANEKCTLEVVEKEVSPSNSGQVQDTDYNYVNSGSTEQYNLLLNQYNAVEKQRQKLLQQLYQYGNWDSQGYSYDYGYGNGAAYDSQYHTVCAPQTSGPPVCTCHPYVCPYSTAPCTSLAPVPSSETCVGSTAWAHKENLVSADDDAFIKAAMGAVDKTIYSFNKEASGIPDVDQDGKKGQEVKMGSIDVAQDKISQTDLSAVLNAWFSAGFYTGKYFSEQASAKK